MADNIAVTPGAGKIIAGDEVASILFQKIKLTESTAGSTTPTGVAANPLQVSLANTAANATAVKVDGSAATQPVSGPLTDTQLRATAVPVSGPLTDTQLRATPVPISGTVTGGGGTQYTEDAAAAANPIGNAINLIRADVPAGVVTTDGDNLAQRGNNFGAGYVSVLDNAGGYFDFALEDGGNLASIANATKSEDAPSAGGDVGFLMMAVRQDTPANTSGADGDFESPKMSAGRLWASSIITAIVPGTGATNLGKAEDAAHISGDVGIEILAVRNDTRGTLAGTDGDYAPIQVNANGEVRVEGTEVLVDDAAFTPATSRVSMAGFQADESSTDSVDEGDAGAARMTLDRKQIVTVEPHTAGGLLNALLGSADGSSVLTNAAQAIKASAGQLYGWYIYNPNAVAIFVSIYNVAAASVTVGTTNPQMSLCIPPTSAANILGAVGIEFTNAGFSAAATTTGGGNTAPTTGLEANFFYK